MTSPFYIILVSSPVIKKLFSKRRMKSNINNRCLIVFFFLEKNKIIHITNKKDRYREMESFHI